MVRDYSFTQSTHHTHLSTHYNKLLQEEKDAHLEARLEKDVWIQRYGRCVEMLREAYRRRCEEEEGVVEEDPLRLALLPDLHCQYHTASERLVRNGWYGLGGLV